MKSKCDATIVFGDDYGDNECTFHCELEEGHNCKHRETGIMDKKKYILNWGDK